MKILIYGAGSTGCYLGALLKLSQHEVTLLGRQRIQKEIEQAQGIRIQDYLGLDQRIRPDYFLTELHGEECFDVVFITLKCHQLGSAVEDLQKLAQQGAYLYFMQNGIGSLDQIREFLPADKMKQGIIPFNVLSQENATFFRATDGILILEQSALSSELNNALSSFGFKSEVHDQMAQVIYGKLLLNLNNALNAITDLPIKTQLENKKLRKVLAHAMRELLALCKAKGLKPYQFTAVKPELVPFILNLPNFLFTRVATAMLDIDPQARSSMWEDIQSARKTEIEYLNEAIVNEAKRYQLDMPVNRGIAKAIHQLEKGDSLGSQKTLNDLTKY